MIIGKNSENKNVEIDLQRLISTRLLIQANAGGGKSWLIRRLLEQTHGKVQQIVIDIEGEFSTLREKFDYLLVGKEGEIPANIQTAELLARKLLSLNVSTIIDLSELKHHERILFVKRFLDSLVNAPRNLWHPCLIIVDEAHQFCPEKAKSESANSVIDLMSRGRKRGFCGVLATQRIAKLNKDAAAECTNGFVGRTVMDIDRKRAAYDLGFTTKEQELSLKKMGDGEFFAYGPAISKDDYVKVKIGDVETTHPEPGKSILKSSETPDNIKSLLKDVIDLPKEVEEELKTKKDYLNKINELNRELGSKPKPNLQIDSNNLNKARKEGWDLSEKEHKKEFQFLKEKIRKYDIVFLRVKSAIDTIDFKITPTPGKLSFHQSNVPLEEKVPYQKSTSDRSVTNPSLSGNKSVTNDIDNVIDNVIDLGICAKKIYSFLYNHPERAFSKSHIGAFTGYSHKSGGFSNAVSQLNGNGLVTKNNGSLQVKNMDPSLAGEYDFSKEAIMSNLGACAKKIYQLLLDNPYEEYSKEQLGEETGYSHGSGGFSNALSKLNSLGLIIKDNSHIKLNPELMEL